MSKPNVFENSKEGTVSIDGMVIVGEVSKDVFCEKCDSREIYYEDFDSYFCPHCNQWLEEHCHDSGCDFCDKRPKKPLNK